jgi:hypothetical protein
MTWGMSKRLDAKAAAWPMAARVERQARLMGEMMHRVSVDPGAAASEGRGIAFAAASRRWNAKLHDRSRSHVSLTSESVDRALFRRGEHQPGSLRRRALLSVAALVVAASSNRRSRLRSEENQA